MTDLTKLLTQIQNPEVSHTDMIKRRAMGTSQWFLERDQATHPIHNNNHLDFFMCGQEGFMSIQNDILKASQSIDLVLWGFDPAMELVRSGGQWPRGTTYGDLLTAKGRAGVTVRMLIWYGSNTLAHLIGNVPDMGMLAPATIWGLPDEMSAPSTEGLGRDARLEARHRYNHAWWDMALRKKFTGIEVRLRKAHADMVKQNIHMYLPTSAPRLTEYEGMILAGTHHQKPVLIDYAAKGKAANTCGYVMGLNSVTDYWDTSSHLFNEPLREDSEAGANWTSVLWHLKPYRDYAIRVQGEALYSINENFVQGWDNADGFHGRNGVSILNSSLGKERSSIQPKDLPVPVGARHRAQILRTFPDKLDATILKAYILASSNATSYIYVENQYVQLADWSKLIKKVRKDYLDGMKAAGAKPSDIVPLYVFVVLPQPERDQMVPNTYDTLAQLGQGQDMATYDKKVQAKQKMSYEEYQADVDNQGGLAVVADSAKDASTDPKGDLASLGINAVAAMLMTYDAGREAKNVLLKDRDSNAQNAYAAQQVEANKRSKTHGGKANDVDLTNYSEYNITPGSYREIYIHSKLMLVDDTFTTVGSANLNARSMVGDSEFNICTDDKGFTAAARKRAWANLAGSDLDGGNGTQKEIAESFGNWKARMSHNADSRKYGNSPEKNSFIHRFDDARDEPPLRLV